MKSSFTAMQVLLMLIGLVLTVQTHAQKKNDSPYFKVTDIRYSDKSKNSNHTSLDIYMPRKGSNSPVVVWIHGGVWSFGDKSDVENKPEFFTSNGYVFVSVNHRLSPEARFPDHARDVADALAWIVKNIVHYSGDASKIFLVGYASGAHLAAFVTINENLLREAGVPPKSLRGVVLLDGIGLDIPVVMTDATNKVRDWCISTFGDSEQDWIDASPVSYVRSGISLPPYLILYSGTKSPVEKEALSISRKLTDAGLKNKVINYPKKNNLSLNKELGREGDVVGQDILYFFYENLRN
ncbi:MAG: alpha/beta hydrolase [Cyclobacteriaceae bacterium]|nr:alpha/beta hydrolase [Cyclobacteriaceae bacterium]MDW8331430.1 alpha/beta hydrolase [Cyclobacteriaceae bacterium]